LFPIGAAALKRIDSMWIKTDPEIYKTIKFHALLPLAPDIKEWSIFFSFRPTSETCWITISITELLSKSFQKYAPYIEWF
jgi:hypothetical protein